VNQIIIEKGHILNLEIMPINKKIFWQTFFTKFESKKRFLTYYILFGFYIGISCLVTVNIFYPLEEHFSIPLQDAIKILLGIIVLGLICIFLFFAILAYNRAKYDISGLSYEERELKNIIDLIQKFIPDSRWRLEKDYHENLYYYLKQYYPDILKEYQKGSSRPDIVIDHTAIEIKGPTSSKDLDTIASKLLRYPHHFDHIILVLFDLRTSSIYYDEWQKGLQRAHPDTIIILK
jgi:hypothetical protein